MAEFNKIVPVLKVSDMQRAVDFYTGILGFTVRWREPNDGGGDNCMLEGGATKLLLSTGSHLGDKPQFTGTGPRCRRGSVLPVSTFRRSTGLPAT